MFYRMIALKTRLNPARWADGFSDAIAQLAELMEKDSTGKGMTAFAFDDEHAA